VAPAANVVNTSGDKRLVALIKVTGGADVGRAEVGDKTERARTLPTAGKVSYSSRGGVARSTKLISLVELFEQYRSSGRLDDALSISAHDGQCSIHINSTTSSRTGGRALSLLRSPFSPRASVPIRLAMTATSIRPFVIQTQSYRIPASIRPRVIPVSIMSVMHLRLMPGFHHSVAVLPLPFRRSVVVKCRCSVKIT